MANQEYIDILKKGADVWNKWRDEHPNIQINFIDANLEDAILTGINFRRRT